LTKDLLLEDDFKAASDRRRNNTEGFQDLHLNAKARIWH